MNENVVAPSGGPLFFPTTLPTTPPTGSPHSASVESETTSSWDPSRGPSSIELDAAEVSAMGEAELQQQILQMLACLRRCPMQEVAAGAAHTDGTLAVASMTAVWVISTVGKAFGRRLVRLSDVDPDSLRSVGSIARLIKQAVTSAPSVGVA